MARGERGIYDIGLAVTVTQLANEVDNPAIVCGLVDDEIGSSNGIGSIVFEGGVVRHDEDRWRNHQLPDMP